MMEAAVRLGLDPKYTTIIEKEYSYQHTQRIDSTLREDFGMAVYKYSDLREAMEKHFQRIDDEKFENRNITWRQTIVVDDGGYIYPTLHQEFARKMSLVRGVVEQTSSGISVLRPFERDNRIPIFNVAESDLKTTVEANGVATAGLRSVRSLLPHERIEGRSAVIIGYGRIGAALAEVLDYNNVRVAIYDTAVAQLVAGRERGFRVGQDLPDLISSARPRYIFACGHRNCMGQKEYSALSRDCYLISLTSRDYAFDKEALRTAATAVVDQGRLGTKYLLANASGEVAATLIANGFPVNFHHSESMPNQQSDLVMASMLLGACYMAEAYDDMPTTCDPRAANQILSGSRLLERYLDLYE
jgi:S-adenosylhomocysteine hydrolase